LRRFSTLLLAVLVLTFGSEVAQAEGPKPNPIDLSRADVCNFIALDVGQSASDPLCLLPFPDDFHTSADPSSATGRRVAFTNAAMPRNALGEPITAAAYNLNDGFSPGQAIVLKVPGLDTPAALAETRAVPLDHLGQYARKRAPVVVLDAETGERQPIWVELDSNATTPARTALLIHPARNFESGHRYIVALRKLKDADG
jgi:hypothetical protein